MSCPEQGVAMIDNIQVDGQANVFVATSFHGLFSTSTARVSLVATATSASRRPMSPPR